MKNYESPTIESAGSAVTAGSIFHQFDFLVTAEVAAIFVLAAVIAAIPLAVGVTKPPEPK